MNDFSPWDIADSFRLHEAACLIVGVMPLSKRVPDREELPAQAIPIYIKLGSAYVLNWASHHQNLQDDPRYPKLKGIDEIPTLPEVQPLKKLTGELASRKELHRWVKAMGIKSAYSFAPVAEMDTAPEQTTSTPVPVVAVATASDASATLITAPAWSLITSLARTPGYRWPLYQFLQVAHVAGKPCPKAQDVLDAWKLKPPPGLRVVQSGRRDELEYELTHGGKKTADLRAIQTSISGLLV